MKNEVYKLVTSLKLLLRTVKDPNWNSTKVKKIEIKKSFLDFTIENQISNFFFKYYKIWEEQ
jgi:hypothetical protein